MKFHPWHSLAAFFRTYDVTPGTPENLALADKLVAQEFTEMADAQTDLNRASPGSDEWEQARADFAQETADTIYVLCYRAYAHGIDLAPVLDAVQWANLSKVGEDGKIHLDEDGKVLKPPTWRKPDFRRILADQVVRHEQAA